MIRIINLETDVEKKEKITTHFDNYDLKYELITWGRRFEI